jgi:hypothetical protein
MKVSERKEGMLLGPNEKHHPNKNESKELRRLMQKSGETEDQVRAKKENRIKLSTAQKPKESNDESINKRYKFLVKRAKHRIAKYLNVNVWDEQVEIEMKESNSFRGSKYDSCWYEAGGNYRYR